MSEQQPSEEEMRAALEEQMRHIRVEDVLLQTVVTLINLGARRLGLTGPPEQGGDVDPEQARLAIEGARALMPLVPGDDVAPIRDALSQLQMAYVQMAEGGRQTAGETAEGGEQAPPPAAAQPDEEAERAKARSKIWTPGS
jgi:hypothetical protein